MAGAFCKSCRFWDPARYAAGWGTCQLAKSYAGEANVSETKAIAKSSSQFAAWLATRENFGCVQHAPKATAQKLPESTHGPRVEDSTTEPVAQPPDSLSAESA